MSLVLAVLVAVQDCVRSVATQSVDLMSASALWVLAWPSSMVISQDLVAHYLHPEAWRSFHAALSDVPASGLLLVVALIFWMGGYRKVRARPQVFAALAP